MEGREEQRAGKGVYAGQRVKEPAGTTLSPEMGPGGVRRDRMGSPGWPEQVRWAHLGATRRTI